MEDRIIDILKHVEGISTSDGLKYCGSGAAYVKFIRSFYSSIEKKAADIEEAYEKGDFELYTTQVHALKSTARIAGVASLSDYALQLEEAGRSGDHSFIKDNTGKFLEMFKSYKGKLSVLENANEENESAKEITEDELKDAYRSLAESVAAQDYDAVEIILNEVGKFRLPKSDKELFHELDTLLKNMEWEEMEKKIKVSL